MRILIDISETEEKENVYVNCDIPDHSIVIGNPCIIKIVKMQQKDMFNMEKFIDKFHR